VVQDLEGHGAQVFGLVVLQEAVLESILSISFGRNLRTHPN
jgi:hypothetical protein